VKDDTKAKDLLIRTVFQGDKDAVVELGDLLDAMCGLINRHSSAIKSLSEQNKKLREQNKKLEGDNAKLRAEDLVSKLKNIPGGVKDPFGNGGIFG